jgi:hypothetical protein
MNDAVTGAKLADDACDSEHYTDGSIDTAHLSADCVDDTKLADDAVVDANIDKSGAFSMFGTWATQDSTPATFIPDAVYRAGSDGFVTAWLDEDMGTTDEIKIRTSTTVWTAGSGTVAATRQVIGGVDTYSTSEISIMCPIKKNDYWEVATTGLTASNVTIHWLPVGTGECVKQ